MKGIAILVMLATLASSSASAQATLQPDVWRVFAQQIDVGSRVKVSRDDGQRVTATLIQAGPEALLVQPRTRMPVPVQRVTYEEIVSIERDNQRGIGAGKAVGDRRGERRRRVPRHCCSSLDCRASTKGKISSSYGLNLLLPSSWGRRPTGRR